MLFPKVIVLCSNSQGEPEFHRTITRVSAEERLEGRHYELAVKDAEAHGFEGPMVAFDSTDQAARQLKDLAAWLEEGA